MWATICGGPRLTQDAQGGSDAACVDAPRGTVHVSKNKSVMHKSGTQRSLAMDAVLRATFRKGR